MSTSHRSIKQQLFKGVIATILLSVLFAAPVVAAQRASAKWGAQLFKDPSFAGSPNSKSCLSCHADAGTLKPALAKLSREKMTEMINKCISGQLQGHPLEAAAEEMRAIRMYFNRLSFDCSTM